MGSVFGKLSREDLEFLKSNTACDEKSIKRMYKEFKKKSKKGNLSPALFYDMYIKLCPTSDAKEFCNHVFRTFDRDNNGYVSFKEFLLAVNISSSGKPEEKLDEQIFQLRGIIEKNFFRTKKMPRIRSRPKFYADYRSAIRFFGGC